MTSVDLTQWIKHDGGKCPVGPNVAVEVLRGDGKTLSQEYARIFSWAKLCGPDSKIIAYRLSDVTELRQGDFVSLEGLSLDQHQDMLDAFVEAWARDADSGNHQIGDYYNTLIWSKSGDAWVTSISGSGQIGIRQLTYQQVMDAAGRGIQERDPAHFGVDPAVGCDTTGHMVMTRKSSRDTAEAVEREWDGNGLPPVGTMCEYDDAEHGWVKTRILAHHPDGGCAWHESISPDGFADGKSYSTDGPGNFRPLRPEEDDFASEAVDHMTRAVKHKAGEHAERRHLEIAAKALHRAGYRKA